MINKTAGVIMGAIMIIASVVLLAFEPNLAFPCICMAAIGYFAMKDGMDNSDDKTS